ncbi:MAG TPA: FMN-binding negative transcriptional regulator [Parafilimonas sp.]|nr:FMN-binding negative transcriptional regulator [Parafilimonas sp.]
MYNIPYFKAQDHKEVLAFMFANPFIILCGCDADNSPVATHVPVLIEERDEKIFLKAHVMRKQKHAIAFEQNQNVLAIFFGAHTYVSASWYETKEIASTWNYQAVHAKGILQWKDENFLRSLLTDLTEKFENNPHSPSLVTKMTDEYVSNMMKAIVAFEIEITSIEHVFKLSQNRDEKSYEHIIEHLNKGDGDAKAVAAAMKENQHNVFKK